MKMSEESPKIEFPCVNYPIKILGFNKEAFKPFVMEVLQQFATEYDAQSLQMHPSKNGTYVSLAITITAQSEQHLKNLNAQLVENDLVKLVL